MIIRVRKPSDLPSSEITSESVYVDRRRFIRDAAAGAAALALAPKLLGAAEGRPRQQIPARFQNMKSELGEDLNSYEDVTTYNNFYEFGTAKGDPAKNSGPFNPNPWTVSISGHVNKPGDYQLEDFLAPHTIEDRVYRLRCVEAWSMVIPWRGFPLADLVRRVEPTGNAKYLEFKTVVRPEEMVGQRRGILDWPYVEGLRLDEAMNPLALLATGVYGMDLPNQNGAPLRLITPWKYGFKGVKSIVSIRFVEEMPVNTWQVQNSNEYGFFANVNPEVDHPRWTQARERRLGEIRRRRTLMFNGYGDEVAHMYAGMDLQRWK
ncbi:MAG: protein-methionine-sulfoxide reductase catalytic subunit MsrP [Gemmatimonadales bacterium]|jgi:sulfoxide reductase catalytic subunit YedY|nr:protein-methionine-sulfoxide reductase catalytic subunit MsrP [Gemmatimonadales bacterium]